MGRAPLEPAEARRSKVDGREEMSAACHMSVARTTDRSEIMEIMSIIQITTSRRLRVGAETDESGRSA